MDHRQPLLRVPLHGAARAAAQASVDATDSADSVHGTDAAPRLPVGAQAGERRLAALLAEAGFSSVRRATQTPFNLILEARP
jgi:hypothetical protein